MDSGSASLSSWYLSRMRCACLAPSLTAKTLGILKGSNPWRLRPVGNTSGLRITSPPAAGRMKRPSNASNMPATSVSADISSLDLTILPNNSSKVSRVPSSSNSGWVSMTLPKFSPFMSASTTASSTGWSKATSAIAFNKPKRSARGGTAPTTCKPCGIKVYSNSSNSLKRLLTIFCKPFRSVLSHTGSALQRSISAACAWIRSPKSIRSWSASLSKDLKRSIEAFKSARPAYKPACVTGGVR